MAGRDERGAPGVPVVGRRGVLAGLGALAAASVAAGPAAAGPRRRRTVYVAGDSTAAPKTTAVEPEVGWAMGLPYYLDRRIAVENYALSGRSSKSFEDEGRLAEVLERIRPGDILVVQFGHNDQKAQDPALYTEPWSTYQEHLRHYLDGARSRHAIPVLATSVERRRFDADGDAYSSHGEYPAAMRALADAECVPLIDVQAQTLALWQELGPDATKQYFMYDPFEGGRRDNTHLQTKGGAAVARMVARGLADHRLIGRRDLRRTDHLVPDTWFSWPEVPSTTM